MKDKKKLFIIIGSIVILLGIILGVCIMFFNGSDKKNDTKPSEENSVSDKIVAPAANTEELLQEMDTVEITNVTEDEIVFSNDVELKENDKVAVWIYSEPKFLGYFEVLVENGTKKIVGLKEALENVSIEDGKHNIAITTESGENIGYIDVYVKDNGKLTESTEVEESEDELKEEQVEEKEPETTTEKPVSKTTTKKITETVDINYETVKENEVNMKKGTTKTTQTGVKGTKEVVYDVTYDESGKEISRKKVSEKTTKQPINEVVKIGVSDFNINTDTTRGWMSGVACPESKTYTATYDGAFHCDDETHTDLEEFGATIMAGKIIVTRVGETKLSKAIIATPVNDYVFVGTYNGQKYYFDNRMGDGEPGTLTLEFCNEYGLSCGSW